jgi:hypothetical protein
MSRNSHRFAETCILIGSRAAVNHPQRRFVPPSPSYHGLRRFLVEQNETEYETDIADRSTVKALCSICTAGIARHAAEAEHESNRMNNLDIIITGMLLKLLFLGGTMETSEKRRARETILWLAQNDVLLSAV